MELPADISRRVNIVRVSDLIEEVSCMVKVGDDIFWFTTTTIPVPVVSVYSENSVTHRPLGDYEFQASEGDFILLLPRGIPVKIPSISNQTLESYFPKI